MSALERQLEASVAYNNERKTQMNALARVPSAAIAPLQFTKEQSQMIRDTYANGASEAEFAVLMEVAKARNLNPLLRQIHFVKRWDGVKKREVWAAQAAIDGIRAVADRTGQYDGQDEPENEYGPDGKLIAVKVRVYRKGIPRPFVGIARWSEYVQKTRDGEPTKFWRDMPHTMLAKCAEALAIRKAFPEDAGGLYVSEEMMQADNDFRAIQTHAEELPRITAHQDDPGFVHVETGAFEELSAKLATLENDLGGCETYDQVLALREMLGSKAKQSQLTKDIQAAGERNELDADQRKALGKVWQRVNRQVEKLEASIKAPGVEASFVDADPEQDGR